MPKKPTKENLMPQVSQALDHFDSLLPMALEGETRGLRKFLRQGGLLSIANQTLLEDMINGFAKIGKSCPDPFYKKNVIKSLKIMIAYVKQIELLLVNRDKESEKLMYIFLSQKLLLPLELIKLYSNFKNKLFRPKVIASETEDKIVYCSQCDFREELLKRYEKIEHKYSYNFIRPFSVSRKGFFSKSKSNDAWEASGLEEAVFGQGGLSLGVLRK